MKLNYKRTFYVGFAFFLISAFWQAYDTTIPLILTNKFGLSQAWSGVLMALDNVLALFLLPLFGALSDRVHTRLGRRTPFILCGTLVAAAAFDGAVPWSTGRHLRNISAISQIDDPAGPHRHLPVPEGCGAADARRRRVCPLRPFYGGGVHRHKERGHRRRRYCHQP